MHVAVVGATGTIGRPLVEALAAHHTVIAVSRSGRDVPGAGVTSIAANAADPEAMRLALVEAEVVYHLVHSLGQPDFETTDLAAGRAVAAAAAEAGARQIVFLGGLGEEDANLSPHLRSRAETAEILARGPVPVTTLRAAMIVGEDSAAFETIRALVDRLPVMICPRWVSVKTQPVALVDVVAALVAVCGRQESFGVTYDVGGPEVMTYRAMMERTARIRGRKPVMIEVPFLTPWLSSLWLHLVTPVNAAVTRPLIEGLRIPTLAREDAIWELVARARTGFDDAVREALRSSA